MPYTLRGLNSTQVLNRTCHSSYNDKENTSVRTHTQANIHMHTVNTQIHTYTHTPHRHARTHTRLTTPKDGGWRCYVSQSGQRSRNTRWGGVQHVWISAGLYKQTAGCLCLFVCVCVCVYYVCMFLCACFWCQIQTIFVNSNVKEFTTCIFFQDFYSFRTLYSSL